MIHKTFQVGPKTFEVGDAKIEVGKYQTTLSTTRNGYQWSGFEITPKLVREIEAVIALWRASLEEEGK